MNPQEEAKAAWREVLTALKRVGLTAVGSPERDAARREHGRLIGEAQLLQLKANRWNSEQFWKGTP